MHFDMPPEAILSGIAFGYNDIRANWNDATWWLCRVHDSSRSSRQPVLALTNYVLVQGDDFLMADMRPHGLFELVLGHRQVVFPTFVPRWINLPILQTFLAPLVSRTHFGITAHGSYNGARIGNRLILCESGFFIRLHIQATVFLLGELYNNAPLQAMTLHAVSYHPSAYDVRRSTVYIAGGYTLISSRIYERTDVHSRSILKGCIYQRFPDVVDFNFDLVKVHWSISAIEPLVNHARFHYVLAVLQEIIWEIFHGRFTPDFSRRGYFAEAAILQAGAVPDAEVQSVKEEMASSERVEVVSVASSDDDLPVQDEVGDSDSVTSSSASSSGESEELQVVRPQKFMKTSYASLPESGKAYRHKVSKVVHFCSKSTLDDG